MLSHLLGLTPKQKAFADAYVELNGNGPEAAMLAYDCGSRNTARVMSFRNLYNPKVLDYLENVIARDDLPERVVDSLMAQMEATKPIRAKGGYIDFPDWKARWQGIKTVLKIYGI